MLTNPQEVIICRCEDVTLAEIRQLIREGYRSLDELKRLLRCGMGPCQGRTCLPLIAQELAAHGVPIAEQRWPTFRPPTKPVKLELFAREDDPDG